MPQLLVARMFSAALSVCQLPVAQQSWLKRVFYAWLTEMKGPSVRAGERLALRPDWSGSGG